MDMRRRAFIAGWVLSLWLMLGGMPGCAWFGMQGRDDHKPPTPEQAARIQQISERAQAAIDRGDLEQARAELLELVAQDPSSVEARQRLGMVWLLEGRPAEAAASF